MSPQRFDDDELAALFAGEPELLDLAGRVRAGRPQAPLRPHFEAQLRGLLLAEAPTALRPRGLFGGRLLPRRLVAGSMATVGVALAAVTLFSVLHHSGGDVFTENLHPVASIAAGAVVSPDQVITLAFDQPMDRASVERAVHITPATAYTTSWSGNTLTITPRYHLAGGAAYVVSLDNRTVRATSGARLVAPVVIPFGTKPVATPVPTPTPAPQLAERSVGQATTGSALAAAPGGGVIAGSGLSSGQPAASPTPTASASPPTSPTATATATTTATATPGSSGTPQPQLVRLGDGTTTVLGPAASAVALSPASHSVATLVPDGDHADVVVANLDGSNRRVVSRGADASSPLAWTGSGILYVGGGRVRLVDVSGAVRTPNLPAVTPGGPALLVRDGSQIAVLSEPAAQGPNAPATTTPSAAATSTQAASSTVTAGSGGAVLVDLRDGSSLTLPDGAGELTASQDGSTLAWVAQNATSVTVELAPVPATLSGATLQPVIVGLPASAISVKAVALSPDGSLLAAEVVDRSGTPQLLVLDRSGHLRGQGLGLDAPLFVSPGTIAGLAPRGLNVSDVVLATVSTVHPGADPNAVPVAAGDLLDRFVAAQSSAQPAALAALPTAKPGPDVTALTPAGITQAYAVTVSTRDGGATVSAQVRLLHIPDATENSGTVTVADETVTLRRSGDGTYVISALTVTALAPQGSGPHVLRAQPGGSPGGRTLSLAFDSDLDPASVAHAVTVSGLPEGVTATVNYDAPTRNVVVTLPAGIPSLTRLTITVDTTLTDIDGNSLGTPYSTTILA